MSPEVLADQDLAARGIGRCRMCQRQTPITELLTFWYLSTLVYCACPDCLGQRDVVISAKGGAELLIRAEAAQRPSIVLATDLPQGPMPGGGS